MTNTKKLAELNRLIAEIHALDLGADAISIVYTGDPLTLAGAEPISDEFVKEISRSDMHAYEDILSSESKDQENLFDIDMLAQEDPYERPFGLLKTTPKLIRIISYFKAVQVAMPGLSFVRFRKF